MFEKILIANRGEIAVRIIRACRLLGIRSVAVYSEADAHALHVRMADEAVCIGPPQAVKSYLHMEQILSAAVLTGADAIHPGYGLLSENSRFARRCALCGITFIGPSPEAIDLLGNKATARMTMMDAGVPVVPGSEPLQNVEEALEEANRIGYPVMLKAVSGGGGKGMREAHSADELSRAFPQAVEEARKAFGDERMYMERLIQHPRHIEFQIMADSRGTVIHLGERDCSIQRHHQKVVEEAPACALDPKIRRSMGEAAVRAAKAVDYEGAGTVEFLLEPDGHFYFMEMNTRIQVEHPVTEEVCGVDLVAEQIWVASGEPLQLSQDDVRFCGHAIECRINAEDPARGFAPCPGRIESLHFPGGPDVRIDSYVDGGSVVSPYYDSMLAKLIVHGKTREEAITRMRAALSEAKIEGIATNIGYLSAIMKDDCYRAGKADIEFCSHFHPDMTDKSNAKI